MNVTVHVLPTKKETKRLILEDGATAEVAIRSMGLYPDQWIPVLGERPIPLDEPLVDGAELKLISVVSGG